MQRKQSMSFVQTTTEVEYPETDGKPMGETDLHRGWMIRIHDLLSYRYRGQRVYVGCNMLVYHSEGNPHDFSVPDNFVVQDCDPGQRRVFKVWEEGKGPDVVFEVTSRSTRREDTVFKPLSYAQIGVKEYFLYDPTGDYLKPPLQGFRLAGGKHKPIKPDKSGAFVCRELGILFKLVRGQLVMFDQETGQQLHTESETERAAREMMEVQLESAESRATAAESRADAAAAQAAEETLARQAAEDEIRRLREQLSRRNPSAD
jgi:Uma2 family endonuclease